jgi:hypothetical protein
MKMSPRSLSPNILIVRPGSVAEAYQASDGRTRAARAFEIGLRSDRVVNWFGVSVDLRQAVTVIVGAIGVLSALVTWWALPD